ncbi:hypothetical protein BAL199_25259 [alpha proteobacterium BAL199]|nr:hypothetical protein BAL199_25259 [alpha proteobacterium BAL199]
MEVLVPYVYPIPNLLPEPLIVEVRDAL